MLLLYGGTEALDRVEDHFCISRENLCISFNLLNFDTSLCATSAYTVYLFICLIHPHSILISYSRWMICSFPYCEILLLLGLLPASIPNGSVCLYGSSVPEISRIKLHIIHSHYYHIPSIQTQIIKKIWIVRKAKQEYNLCVQFSIISLGAIVVCLSHIIIKSSNSNQFD